MGFFFLEYLAMYVFNVYTGYSKIRESKYNSRKNYVKKLFAIFYSKRFLRYKGLELINHRTHLDSLLFMNCH